MHANLQQFDCSRRQKQLNNKKWFVKKVKENEFQFWDWLLWRGLLGPERHVVHRWPRFHTLFSQDCSGMVANSHLFLFRSVRSEKIFAKWSKKHSMELLQPHQDFHDCRTCHSQHRGDRDGRRHSKRRWRPVTSLTTRLFVDLCKKARLFLTSNDKLSQNGQAFLEWSASDSFVIEIWL